MNVNSPSVFHAFFLQYTERIGIFYSDVLQNEMQQIVSSERYGVSKNFQRNEIEKIKRRLVAA
jgi:hypothetical protein